MKESFWLNNLYQLIELYHSDKNKGFDSDVAQKYVKRYEYSTITKTKKKSWLWQILVRFKNQLILLLLVVGVVSLYFKEIPSFIIISIITLINVLLDFYQEYRVYSTIESLKKFMAL